MHPKYQLRVSFGLEIRFIATLLCFEAFVVTLECCWKNDHALEWRPFLSLLYIPGYWVLYYTLRVVMAGLEKLDGWNSPEIATDYGVIVNDAYIFEC